MSRTTEFLDRHLGSARLWRRFRGGVWERWKLDMVGDPVVWFFDPTETWVQRGARPDPRCRGRPETEDYRPAHLARRKRP